MVQVYIWWCYFFFFFQAEDGIRDIGVTGVQTCALPISPESDDYQQGYGPEPEFPTRLGGVRGARCVEPEALPDGRPAQITFVTVDNDRSEERRVGKECRSRWSPYH